MVKICELFSLVPSLAIKSEEYEVLYHNQSALRLLEENKILRSSGFQTEELNLNTLRQILKPEDYWF